MLHFSPKINSTTSLNAPSPAFAKASGLPQATSFPFFFICLEHRPTSMQWKTETSLANDRFNQPNRQELKKKQKKISSLLQ